MNNKILACGGQSYSASELIDALKALGIEKGDTLCVHSQIFSLGRPLISKEEFLHRMVLILEELVGESGTLIMPAFSYSFCKGEEFDVKKTPSDVGILSDWFRGEEGVARTEHPIFSFSVWGKKREWYRDIGPDAFGLDSVYGKMIRDGGKILMLGANRGYTFHYLAEEHAQVPYRFFKEFRGVIVDANGDKRQSSVPYYVRYLDQKSEFDEGKYADFLIERNIQKQSRFGKGTLAVFSCKEAYEAGCMRLAEDKCAFL